MDTQREMTDVHLTGAQARAAEPPTRSRILAAGMVALLGAALLTALPTSASANEIVVTTPLDDTVLDAGDDPACPTSGTDQCTLRAAVAAADDGDVITFADGVHPEIAGASGPIRIEDLEVTIRGNLDAGGPGTTISAASDLESRMFEVNDLSDATFEHVVVTGANLTGSDGLGGAVLNAGALQLTNTRFVDNRVAVTNGGGGAIASSGTLAVNGSTFADNRASGASLANPASGGAIRILAGGTAQVSGSDFTGNEATRIGGAIAVEDASIAIADSTFGGTGSGDANVARSGGAVSIGGDESSASGTISRSRFEGNRAEPLGEGATASYGGAIYVTIAEVTITDTSILDNVADTNGGGIGIFGSSAEFTAEVSLVRSTVADNRAQNEGGGVSIDTGVLLAENSTLSGNAAEEFGGAVSAVGSPPQGGSSTFVHTTVTGNDASGMSPAGGGLVYYLGATATLSHTIVADNLQGDCVVEPGALSSDGFNLDSDGTCAEELEGATDATVDDIGLAPLGSNGGPTSTHLPLEGSPAINGGLNPTCLVDVDQRGLPRPAAESGACDIGAVEVQPVVESEEDVVDIIETEEGSEEPPPVEDDVTSDPATSDDVEVVREAGAAEPITADPDYAG